MDYQDVAEQLVPLETFDSAAFVGASDASQELCDFILALALAYNDFRDTIMVHTFLSDVEPDRSTVTPQLGLHGGLRTALTRVQVGLVNELLALVERSGRVMEEPLFLDVVGKLSKSGREAWQAVRAVAAGRHSGIPLARVLLLVRHKVAFHYDAGQIGVGYRSAFVESRSHGEPMLSRGVSLGQTRFFFADAAAQAYVYQKATDEGAREFLEGRSTLVQHVHHALFDVVTTFVQVRRYAWRSVHA